MAQVEHKWSILVVIDIIYQGILSSINVIQQYILSHNLQL